MSSKPSLSQVLFIFLNLLFLALVVNCTRNCNNPPDHKHKHKHKHHKHKSSSPSSPTPPAPESPKLPPVFPGTPRLPPAFPLPSSPPYAFPGTPRLPGFPLPSSPPFAFPPGTPPVPGFPLPTSPPFAFPPRTPRVPGFPLPRISPPLPGSPKTETCPRDAFRFGACAKVLGGLVGGEVGKAPKQPCCSLFGGLVEAEAAVCLCTAIKANFLGFNLNIPVAISMVLNVCEMRTPPNFQCS
ncbi:hypothetical protein DCAR_0102450 [Daucus carota subsp. sativus]|uniref:Bifunctional inhibitor/plant lipid transfer protein/seed storage helical domain-containing protein n=1 Tax=Daucus carota subsp. sativus TaxID=79200 RepID=A0AAF0W8G6_DAUCS|nr:PREDICTED: pEARLI1-like lipid transfer protein 3 [Daucus carota subsp. sativus]WOG83275.1 hypothetical protein DCAR_0102450 [Daucus carota subsp. sativus]